MLGQEEDARKRLCGRAAGPLDARRPRAITAALLLAFLVAACAPEEDDVEAVDENGVVCLHHPSPLRGAACTEEPSSVRLWRPVCPVLWVT
jgi:hypothetical protein